ncbi:hypothetical protein [Stenotrophomonas sp. Iso1]|uniref:hypothetical protein n=1 Tax=Stenotrophomonas sp. Iso1 TaxID=2977283 RepID=UPI0022B7B633|nr:hypothetical protein [Stenotrophomonas sp. Iso1]
MRLALLMLLALPVTSLAQDCGADSAERIRKAYAQRPAGALPLHSGTRLNAERGTCRVWPADTTLTLMAVPVLGPEEENGAYQDGDLDLLVVDTTTLRPRATLRLPGMMSSDAIRSESVSLDTARYRLSADVRAFGVRIGRSGSSQPNPFNDTRLQLFVLDEERIEPVTGQIVVASFGGEWNTRCTGEFHELSRTVEVGPIPAQGFAQLQVRERSAAIQNREDAAGECVETRRNLPEQRYLLRPQGRHYPLPKTIEATF